MAQNRRIRFIISPAFQLKIALIISSIVLVTSSIYFFVINHLLENFNRIISEFQIEIPEDFFIHSKFSVLNFLFIYQGLVCLIVLVGCLIFTHRIAGPIHRLKMFLSNIRDKKTQGKLAFRKGDSFQDLADDVNATFRLISETTKNDFVYISEISSYINELKTILPEDKRSIMEEIQKKLSEIQSRFNKKDVNEMPFSAE